MGNSLIGEKVNRFFYRMNFQDQKISLGQTKLKRPCSSPLEYKVNQIFDQYVDRLCERCFFNTISCKICCWIKLWNTPSFCWPILRSYWWMEKAFTFLILQEVFCSFILLCFVCWSNCIFQDIFLSKAASGIAITSCLTCSCVVGVVVV